MNQRKIMVVCGDAYERGHIVAQLKQVLVDATDESFTGLGCVRDAAKAFAEAPWQFDLLVVDIHAPPESNPEQNGESTIAVSTGEGGYIFVGEHVLNRGYPPPPILLVSRFGDFKPKDEVDWLNANHLKVSQLGIADFTAVNLDRKFRKLGVSTRLRRLLFDEARLGSRPPFAEGPPEQHVRKKLESCLLEIYRQKHDNRAQRVWEMVREIDDTLVEPGIRKKVFADEEVLQRINEWYHRVQIILDSTGQLSALDSEEQRADSIGWGVGYRDRSWFHMLRAEIAQTLQPVDALYSLMNAMKFNVEANAEPLGGPGDPGYRIALRLHADHKWRFGARLILLMQFLMPAKYKKRRPGYSEQVWHVVLRRQVTKAAKCLKGSPEALLNIENRLAGLSVALQEKGHARAAHELEARSCEVRQGRLRGLGKFVYRLLHLLCDYGNRPARLLVWCLLSVSIFAVLYLPMPNWFPIRCLTIQFKQWPYISTDGLGFWPCCWAWIQNLITAMYFSIVTFVTLGYGDITPINTWGKILAATEAAWGFTMFGLFIAVASTRLRPR